MKKKYTLDENKKNIKFKINSGTVTIYRDNIIVPTLYYSDKFDIKENNGIIVKQRVSSKNSINIGGVEINTPGNSLIVVRSNVTIVNDKIIPGNVVNIESDDTGDVNIEFAVPEDANDLSFDILINSGALKVRNILINKMNAIISNGTIKMRDVDMLESKLKVMCGQIDLEIRESILNYKTSLSAMNGVTEQNSVEIPNDINIVKKRILKANTMNGNINVLFKGK